MGGMGKTSVALKYADEFKKNYQIIWVIKSDRITLDLISLAIQLGISKDNDTLENFKIFLKSGEITKSTLLIFDNLDEKTQLSDYYTTNSNIKYLITSRSTEWEERIELGPLSYAKSEDYIRLRLVEQDENEESIKALAQRMGGYALGLRQSVASIKKNKFSIQEYLEYIQDLSTEEVIAKSLESIISKITDDTINALELLSYFQPQDIPEEDIKSIIVKKFGVKEWLRARSQLIGCYIISIDSEKKMSMHQIVMEFIRSKKQGTMKELLIQHYYANFKFDKDVYNENNKVKKIKELIPHVSNFLKELELDTVEQILICGNLAKASLIIDFNFKEAERIIENAADKTKNINMNENKEDIANICECFGEVFCGIANYERSEIYYLKCLEIRSQILPPLHPELADIYLSIGILYFNKVDYTKSEEFYLKCLKIKEQILPPLHPDLAAIYLSMGNLYCNKDNYTKSEELYLKCLKILNKILPPLHPQLAKIYNNIGLLHYSKEDYIKSEEFYFKCLNIREQILQPLHPELAQIYNNMGNLYNDKEDYTKSEEFYLKCLKIWEQILPPFHPDLARVYNNMGNLYSDKADYTKSEEFFLKCLKIREQILPPLHPNLATIYLNMGNLYSDKKNYTKSEEFYFKCLRIREQILPLHPDLAIIYLNIGILYSDKEDYTKSEEFYLKCLKIREQILTPLHPDLAAIYYNIGNLYSDKADDTKSEEFYLKCLKIWEQILPPLHPNLAGIYNNMGILYKNMQDYTKSKEFYLKASKVSGMN